MENINYGTPQNNGNANNSSNLAFGVASTTLGVMSLLMLCVPWLATILAAAGLACGIIAWVRIKRDGGQLILPVIGTIVSGIVLLVSVAIAVMFHLTINELDQRYDEMDSVFRNMRDSLQQWDSQFDYPNLPEADSTFFIE